MTIYYVYVHLKDKVGETHRYIESALNERDVRRRIAFPYMKNKPFFLAGKIIHPNSICQILIYRTEKGRDEIILPNGRKLAEEEDPFYTIKSFSLMEGFAHCTSEFITSPPKHLEPITAPIVTLDEKEKVFIVHGRDETEALRLQKYLTKTLNVEAEIFEDFKERSGSKTIIEQLEYIRENVGYAFVVVTPDDLGCLRSNIDKCKANMLIGKTDVKVEIVCEILENLNTRARQNVVFEHGLFIGALGRDRVCCLIQNGIKEKPSDIDGILYVSFGESAKETFPEISEKLKKVGLVKV